MEMAKLTSQPPLKAPISAQSIGRNLSAPAGCHMARYGSHHLNDTLNEVLYFIACLCSFGAACIYEAVQEKKFHLKEEELNDINARLYAQLSIVDLRKTDEIKINSKQGDEIRLHQNGKNIDVHFNGKSYTLLNVRFGDLQAKLKDEVGRQLKMTAEKLLASKTLPVLSNTPYAKLEKQTDPQPEISTDELLHISTASRVQRSDSELTQSQSASLIQPKKMKKEQAQDTSHLESIHIYAGATGASQQAEREMNLSATKFVQDNMLVANVAEGNFTVRAHDVQTASAQVSAVALFTVKYGATELKLSGVELQRFFWTMINTVDGEGKFFNAQHPTMGFAGVVLYSAQQEDLDTEALELVTVDVPRQFVYGLGNTAAVTIRSDGNDLLHTQENAPLLEYGYMGDDQVNVTAALKNVESDTASINLMSAACQEQFFAPKTTEKLQRKSSFSPQSLFDAEQANMDGRDALYLSIYPWTFLRDQERTKRFEFAYMPIEES